MKVQEIAIDGKRKVNDSVDVIWGIKNDTICFNFLDRILCYYPISDSTWEKEKDKQLRSYLRSLPKVINGRNQSIHIRQDYFNEKYAIQFLLAPEHGIIIFITNIDFGYPNYVLTLCHLCK